MNFFKKTFFVLIFGILLFNFFPLQKTTGQNELPLVFLAEVDGEIKTGTFQHLRRAIREAEEEGADYLVIKMDTPGGLLQSTRDIVDLLLATPVKTVVYVHKEGGWAYSAGTFILMASDFAVVHPEASIGAAEPRIMAGEVMETDPKLVEGMVSWIKTLAERSQKNQEIAEKFVRDNLTLTGREAKELGAVNETARDLDELFLKLEIIGPEIIKVQPTASERFFDFLSHPYLISLFLTLGGLGLIFAFRTGEFELSGILGVIFLLIGLWGMGTIQFSVFGLILILLGLFLLILEVFEPGFGIFGGLGIVSLALGVFVFEAEPFLFPGIFEAMTMVVLGAVLSVAALFIIITRGTVKALKTKPQTGSESLIGLEAEVIKELNPAGQVKMKEEIWSAKSENLEKVQEGEKVKIVKVEGNTLLVQKL